MTPQQILDEMHRLMIKREAALWLGSGRAIHSWRLRKIFRAAKWPVPEKIEQYLDRCTERLCEADLTSPRQVAKAFDLGREGRNAKCDNVRLAAVEHVAALKHKRSDASLEELFAEVAMQTGRSQSYVRDAYYEWFPKN